MKRAILLVEDNETLARTLLRLLRRRGHVVEHAPNIALATSMLCTSTPAVFDCVVTDRELPDGDGWRAIDDFMSARRDDKPMKILKIVKMTGSTPEGMTSDFWHKGLYGTSVLFDLIEDD